MATIHAAHTEAKPTAPFICDEYQKKILDIFSRSSGKHSELFKFDDTITFESRQANIWSNGFTMLIRCTPKFSDWSNKLLARMDENQTVIIFSMWAEYINASSRHAKKEYMEFVNNPCLLLP